MTRPRLSIVIPTRGQVQTLPFTLHECTAQTFADCEFVVSDNSGDDAVRDALTCVVADGFMRELAVSHHGRNEWSADTPLAAVHDFLAEHAEFRLEVPGHAFDENRGVPVGIMTCWPDGWLKRLH